MYHSNLYDLLNFTNITYNGTVPVVNVLDPNSQIQTYLLAIIAFCQVFVLFAKFGNWILNDGGD